MKKLTWTIQIVGMIGVLVYGIYAMPNEEHIYGDHIFQLFALMGCVPWVLFTLNTKGI